MLNAACLARALYDHCSEPDGSFDIKTALEGYQHQRFAVANRYARMGTWLGKIQTTRSPLVGYVRDLFNRYSMSALRLPRVREAWKKDLERPHHWLNPAERQSTVIRSQ